MPRKWCDARLLIGMTLIGSGLLPLRTILEHTVVADSTITSQSHLFLITAGRALLISAGLLIASARRMRRLASLFLLSTSIVSALLIAETGARLLWTPPRGIFGWWSFCPDVEQNQLRYRGRPYPETRVDPLVLLVGDSQIEALACPMDSMPESALQRYLHLEGHSAGVRSLGAGGYGQDQQLLALQEYLNRWSAQIVVVWLTPVNDVWNNLFPTHWPANGMPKPTFRLHNRRLVPPRSGIGSPLVNPSIRLRAMIQTALLPRNLDQWWERFLPPPYSPIECTEESANEWQRRWDADSADMRVENLASEKSHLAIRLEPRSPRMEYGLHLTRALLDSMRVMTEARGGRFLLFRTILPSDRDDTGGVVQRLNGRCYRTSAEQFDANILEITTGFDCITATVDWADWRVSAEDGHLNCLSISRTMSILGDRVGEILDSAPAQTGSNIDEASTRR